MKSCPVCGYQNEDSYNVCINCNNKFLEAQSTSASNREDMSVPNVLKEQTTPSKEIIKEEEKSPKKWVAISVIAVVAILIIASLATVLFLMPKGSEDTSMVIDIDGDGIPDSTDTDDDNDGVSDDLELNKYNSDPKKSEDVKMYPGVLIYDSTGSNYKSSKTENTAYLAITNGTTNRSISETKEVIVEDTSSTVISGSFIVITSTDGTEYVYNSSSSTLPTTTGDIGENMVNFEYQNVEVEFNSIGVNYGNYTFGLGLGSKDYLYVSFDQKPTLFTDIHASGVVLPTNFFDIVDVFNIDLTADLSTFEDDFNIVPQGNLPSFLLINTINYVEEQLIEGDVYDVITPENVTELVSDLLSADFFSEGSQYLLNISKNINQQLITLGESTNTIERSVIWFILAPRALDKSELTGVVGLSIAKSDLSTLQQKLGITFEIPSSSSFLEIKVGVCDYDNSTYNSTYTYTTIQNLWSTLELEQHTSTTVDSVEMEGFGIIVDAETLVTSIADAFEIPEEGVNAIKTLTSFKNPGFVLMIEYKTFPTMLNDTGTEAWKYSVISIIPDYDTQNSALRYLNIKGVLYDSALYFNTETNLSHLPLIIVDDYSEVTEEIQQVTVGDLKEGNVNMNQNGWVYVELDAITIGTTLKTIAEALGQPYETIIKAFPLDLCAYEGLQIEAVNKTYQVPVIYLASGKGPTYYELNITRIRGVYIDSQANFESINDFLQGQIIYGMPPLNDLLSYIPELSSITDPITNFMDDLLDSGLVPSGYILAFSINEIDNAPPTPTISEPIEDGTVAIDDFNITLNLQDNPDMILWVEIKISQDGWGDIFAGFGMDVPIPAPVLKNGEWDTGSQDNYWWWSFIQNHIKTWRGNGDYTIKIRAHDFKSYSTEVTVNFTIGGVDSQKPTSFVNALPTSQSAYQFSVDAIANDNIGVEAVELWYNKDGIGWTKYANDTSGPTWSWSFNSSTTGGDGIYEFYSRAIDASGNYEDAPSGNDTWTIVDTTAPDQPPAPVNLDRPIEPTTTSLKLTWNESLEPDFKQYEVFKSTISGFTPSGSTLITTIFTKTTTSYVVNGLVENTEYYFVVRVNDTGGLYNDSNEVLGATEYSGDSGDDFSTATDVSSRKCWSESIDWATSDYFKIYLTVGQTITVNMTVPPGCDFDLFLYNATQDQVDSSETLEKYEEVSTTATEDGYYYIEVYGFGAVSGVYSLYFTIL